MITRKNALAQYLGFDSAEMPDYRYQPTVMPTPVYTVDGDYYTAIMSGRKIWESTRFQWIKVATENNFDIYESKMIGE
jgi:hypothetical protein